MKKRILFHALLSAFLFCSIYTTQAQKWMEMMENHEVNFYEAQKEFYKYWDNKLKEREYERSNITEQDGEESNGEYMIFKRWEAEMKYFIDEKGNRISPRTIYEEAMKFQSQYRKGADESIQTAQWIEMGPWSWQRTSGWNPGVGRIDAIAVDESNTNVIYIGSPQGGVWKTTDGGMNWVSLTDGLPYMSIGSIAVDPTASNVLYVGTAGAGMLKSTNGGSTFIQINSGLSSTANVKKILVDPINPNNVILATTGGVYRSTNGGSTWTQSRSGAHYDAEFKPGDPSVVYACGTSFYKSTNGGASFTLISSGITSSDYMRIAVTPANPNLVCIAQCAGSVFGKFYRSTDSGTNFTNTITGSSANGTNFFGYSTSGSDNSGQGNYNVVIAISPTDENEIHIGGIMQWRSMDGGNTFSCMTNWSLPTSYAYNHADMHALEYIGNTLYSGSDGGIYKSINKAQTYTDLSKGLGIRMFYRIGCSETNAAMVVGGAQDNGVSIRKATGWTDWLGADGEEALVDHTNANIIYGATQNGKFYKSTNGGSSYSTLSMPESTGAWTTPMVMDRNNGALYVGYVEIYQSLNGGTSWTKLSNFGGSGYFDHLALAPSSTSYIYASKGTAIYRTDDGGANWVNISSGLGSATIARIAVHESSADKVAVITTNSRVYTSVNGGTSWTNITGNLPAAGGRSIVYMNDSTEGLYVGMTTGLYYRDNTMTSWIPYMTGLPSVPVNDLEIHYPTNKIRAGTYGRGLWENDLYGITTKVASNPNAPKSFSVYPNPSNGRFVLSAQFATAATCELEIYNATGALVHRETIETLKGMFSKQLNVSAWGKGIYMIRLSSGTFSEIAGRVVVE